jgi:two-component system, cell cycle sensor histidine kinase and response regulator CckA
MNRFNDLPPRTRLLLTFGTLFAILLIIGGMFFFSLRSVERSNRLQQTRALNKLALIDDIAGNVGAMQAGVLLQVLANDPAEIRKRKGDVLDIEKVNGGELSDYQQFVDSDVEQRLFGNVIKVRKNYWDQTQGVLALGSSNRDVEAVQLIHTKQIVAYDDFSNELHTLIKYVETDADETMRSTARFISQVKIIGDALVGVAILIVIGAGFGVAKLACGLEEDNKRMQSEIKERAEAEALLSRKTAFLEAQVNSSQDGILIVDQTGKKTLCNQRFVDLFSIPPDIADDELDQSRLKWVTDMVRDPEQFLKKVRDLYDHPEQISHDEVELKDGKIIDRYSSPVVGKLDEYYGRIWTFRDITERKRTENSLRESEERFSGAFEHAPIGMTLKRPNGPWLKVNRAFCNLVGYSESELLDRTFRDITHPDDIDATVEQKRRLFLGEIDSFQVEKRYIHAQGHVVTVSLNISLIRDSDGEPVYIIAQMLDITERKRNEELLLLLGSAVEQSKESIVITDSEIDAPGPRILFVNPAFTQMTGYSAEEAIGMTPRILQGPLTDKAVLSRLRQNLIECKKFEGQTINYRKDGKPFALEWQIAPVRNAAGKVTHFMAIQHDITERKRLETQVFQSQKMETVGKLAGGIAHEFNSILTAIIGQSEMILADLPAESPMAQNAIEIGSAANRAAKLTRQLLAYGRKQILQPKPLDLNLVIANMEGMFSHIMGGNVNTRLVPAPGLHTVKADAGQIEQVIMNLAMNAHDAMPNGGGLTLETANVTVDQESVGRYPEMKPGEYVMLAVTDTGIGMSPEVKARVFEPFFSTKNVGQGTGLGLSTCHGIIKQSGGHISVYSELSRGATFKIYLPQVDFETRIPTQRLDSPNLPVGTETILLVEDDPALREMAATLLRRLGYNVLSAANGIEALSLKQQHGVGHIDLLFTDVVMPHMSGKELSDRVLASHPHTRILFTSAYAENAIVHHGILDQEVALLQKPFTPSALAHKLREVLDGSGVPSSSREYS